MADQGRWFKLWCSVLNDPALSNLPLEEFARWCKLGALLKEQGEEGTITLYPPAQALCAQFVVDDFTALLDAFKSLPHITVTCVTNATVTMDNWPKYQGDYSGDRVRKFRERVTPKRRREERRREVPPISPVVFDDLVQSTTNGMPALIPVDDPSLEARKREAIAKLLPEAIRRARAQEGNDDARSPF